MQDRFKVGDYVIFRRFYGDVCRMLDTSFYDVLNSVYKIAGMEGRCYLMRSDNGCGRVWKIRKSRIDRLGTRVTVIDDMAVVTDDERRGSHLVLKSAVKREQHSYDLLDALVEPWMIKHIEEFERLQKEFEKEAPKELAKAKQKADVAKRKELADAFAKDVERLIKGAESMTEVMCRVFDRCHVREKLDVYDIDINNLKGGEE